MGPGITLLEYNIIQPLIIRYSKPFQNYFNAYFGIQKVLETYWRSSTTHADSTPNHHYPGKGCFGKFDNIRIIRPSNIPVTCFQSTENDLDDYRTLIEGIISTKCIFKNLLLLKLSAPNGIMRDCLSSSSCIFSKIQNFLKMLCRQRNRFFPSSNFYKTK